MRLYYLVLQQKLQKIPVHIPWLPKDELSRIGTTAENLNLADGDELEDVDRLKRRMKKKDYPSISRFT
jgi:hypothetical protein